MIELFILLVSRTETGLAVNIASKLAGQYAYRPANLLTLLIAK